MEELLQIPLLDVRKLISAGADYIMKNKQVLKG